MNYKILAATLLMIISVRVYGQKDSETRNYIKSVAVNRETTLELKNKYGTIQITPWDKDSVYIRAEIKAYAKDASKLGKMFDGISVNISDSKYLVRAETEFTSNINSLFESFKGMTSKIISYDSHVEINYFINIPDYINLKIENKYGDVYMENCSGDFEANISNGSFKAGSLGKKASFTLVFCDVSITSIASGHMEASFSEISVGSSEDLTLSSISSKYNIKKAGKISGESKRDKFFIDEIGSLRGNSYFSDYKVDDVQNDITLTTRYGSVDAGYIEKNFESVNINSSYSDISLSFDPSTSFNIDIRHTNAFLVLPDKNITTEERAMNEDKKEYVTSGVYGRSPGKAKVRIEANRGNISLKTFYSPKQL
jgi:hypothetical protein